MKRRKEPEASYDAMRSNAQRCDPDFVSLDQAYGEALARQQQRRAERQDHNMGMAMSMSMSDIGQEMEDHDTMYRYWREQGDHRGTGVRTPESGVVPRR